jgi:hypothetical protein
MPAAKGLARGFDASAALARLASRIGDAANQRSAARAAPPPLSRADRMTLAAAVTMAALLAAAIAFR